jgi:hypothetical protein
MSFLLAVPALAQKSQSGKRYGIEPNLQTYSQGTPQEALSSTLLAVEKNQIEYLLAQLADPDFVDDRVKNLYGGQFEPLVEETTTKLIDNPGAVKELARHAKEGKWEVATAKASSSLSDVPGRQVYFRKVGDRWYLENRQKRETAEPDR